MHRDSRTAGRGEPSAWMPGLQRGSQTSWALVQSMLRRRRWPETLTAWHTRATHGSRQESTGGRWRWKSELGQGSEGPSGVTLWQSREAA